MPVYRLGLAPDAPPTRDYDIIRAAVWVANTMPRNTTRPHVLFDSFCLVTGTIDGTDPEAYMDCRHDVILFELRPEVVIELYRDSTVDRVIARHFAVLRLDPIPLDPVLDDMSQDFFDELAQQDRARQHESRNQLKHDLAHAPPFEAADDHAWEQYKRNAKGGNLRRTIELAERCGRLLQVERLRGVTVAKALDFTFYRVDHENWFTPAACRDNRAHRMARGILKKHWAYARELEDLPEAANVS